MTIHSNASKIAEAISLNFILRIGSFTLTLLIARLTNPVIRGVSFQMDLLVESIGFLVKDSFRSLYSSYTSGCVEVAISGKDKKKEKDTPPAVRLIAFSLMTVPLALLCCVLLEIVALWLPVPCISRMALLDRVGTRSLMGEFPLLMKTSASDGDGNTYYWITPLILFLCGLTAELVSEPFVAVLTVSQCLTARIATEAIALTVSKLFFALSLNLFMKMDISYFITVEGIIAGQQLVYGATLFIIFARCSMKNVDVVEGQLVKKRLTSSLHDFTSDEILFSTQRQISKYWNEMTKVGHYWTVNVICGTVAVEELMIQFMSWWSFFSEGALRLVLSQGREFILAACVSVSSQGIYSAVSSLASLVCRIVFKVWEEGSYNIWAAEMSDAKKAVEDSSRGAEGSLDMEETMTQYRIHVRRCLPLMGSLFRVSGYISILVISLIDVLPRFALTLLFSSKWATDEAVVVLQYFSWYIPILGINGIVEAFIRATATRSAFAEVRNRMAAASVASIAVTYLLVSSAGRGSAGLMEGTLLTMVGRIAIGIYSIASYTSIDTSGKGNETRQHSLQIERKCLYWSSVKFVFICGICMISLRIVFFLFGPVPPIVVTVGQCCVAISYGISALVPITCLVFVLESKYNHSFIPDKVLSRVTGKAPIQKVKGN